MFLLKKIKRSLLAVLFVVHLFAKCSCKDYIFVKKALATNEKDLRSEVLFIFTLLWYKILF
ncbi:hypothetical protein BTI73_07225 [Lactobacillus delbrueckii subsp. bulgaricus]|nr:hypothetical protein [Lactobacillus delbrueckii subsp. bulgaricus]